MAITVVGSAASSLQSVSIPAHQVGDLILIAARGAGTAPTVPAASGTVPAWVLLQSGAANGVGLSIYYFIATATTTTSGNWANATQNTCIVLRAGAGNTLSTAAARSSVGTNTAVATVVYPALALSKTDGTSFGVRVGGRQAAAQELATPPTGWTKYQTQPVTVGAELIALHGRAALTVNPVADTVNMTTGGASGYRAVTVEILETIGAKTVSPTGLGTAQSFGTPVALVAGVPVGGLASAQAFGAVTVKATFLRTVGSVSSAQAFGTPVVKATFLRTVGSVASAQAFGVLTFRVSAPTGGVNSAQSFGVPTVFPGVVARQMVGLASAGAFGAPTIKATVTKASPSVNSAAAFGAVAAKATFLRTVGGVASAALFGVPTFSLKLSSGGVPSAGAFGVPRTLVTAAVPGLSSAAAFGVPRSANVVAPAGIPSAAAFGTPRFALRIAINGVASSSSFGTPVPRVAGLVVPVLGIQGSGGATGATIVGRFLVGDGHLVGAAGSYFGRPTAAIRETVTLVGLGSAQSFGVPQIKSIRIVAVAGLASARAFGTPVSTFTRTAGGVPSAAAFGVPRILRTVLLTGLASAQSFGTKLGFKFTVLGVRSAGNFGRVSAFVVYMRPPSCVDLPLVGSGTTAITLAPSVAAELALQPAGTTTLTLASADEDSVDLDPAGCN